MRSYIEGADELFNNMSPTLRTALIVVAALILVVAVVSTVVDIVLAIKYARYNRKANSAHLTGEKAARKILDANGLQNIAVKATGSMIFGNSYGHYSKKVRLRRMTRYKESLTALAMGSEKAALAVMDKEEDPDMKTRNRLFPIVTFGPLAFIPLIVVGAIIDYLLLNASGKLTIALIVIGLVFYVSTLILSIVTLKTEKKAQKRAYELLRENGMATEEEIDMMKGLFKLYNIQYVNNIVMSVLETIYYILRLVVIFSNKGSSKGSSLSE